ncbi:MAG: PAS domain S-box protein [Blastocatellia bacterium]|nr:PAS domain S-box protein [Blastocatellia bacterium]
MDTKTKDRFLLDRKENILFIDFSDLKIESREQIEEFASLVKDAFLKQGKRMYAVVNYDSTEISPEIIDYYGERLKQLQERYAISTVRYSSSGFTRSVLRFLGAAKDLESNTFATRQEAINAIKEMKSRTRGSSHFTFLTLISPYTSLLGSFLLVNFLLFILILLILLFLDILTINLLLIAVIYAIFTLVSGALIFFSVIKPLIKIESVTRRFIVTATSERLDINGSNEVAKLGQTLNLAAETLRQEIDRLSGLYYISLMMGTVEQVSDLCALVTRKIAKLLSAEMCVIVLYDKEKDLAAAQFPAFGIDGEHLDILQFEPSGSDIAAKVFRLGEAYLSNNVVEDQLIDRTFIKALSIKELLVVPLQTSDQTIGVIEVMNRQGGFVEEDKRLVTIFATQAAQLLSNTRLIERLKESEERYREIFESALDGIYRTSSDGNLIIVNPKMATMLGYNSPEELVGKNLFTEIFSSLQKRDELLHSIDNEGQKLDFECELVRKDLTHIPTIMSVRKVTDKRDLEPYYLGIVRDITEQKRLKEQLIVSERLAVVGQLVAGVAHEVRNPLFGITTTLSAVERELGDKESVKPYLKIIMSEVDQLNHLMEQLLEHSCPVRLDADPVSILEVINDAVDDFKRKATDRSIAIEIDAPERDLKLSADRRKLLGMFTNLIANALEHTSAGGKIFLVVKKAAQEMEIEIRDTGKGIAPKDLNRIFEPFFTTRSKGTGLGLAIVRKTVVDHGGTIEVDSQLDQGTTFRITFPSEIANGSN